MDTLLSGRYRTRELIGTGGAASVYRAVDESLGRHVAVKMFTPTTPDDDEYRRQHTETLLLATLNHPGLVTLLDAGLHTADDGATTSFLVMELIQGPDLRRRMQRESMSEAEAAQIGADLADALNYVHEQGVIHRDVKPANILLANSNSHDTRHHPKLSDFGIARMVEASVATAKGATIGTASYLSPEQAMSEPVTGASDVYSLGLVLLECLTGTKAFPGPAVEAAVARLLRDPEIPDSLDPDWADLLAAMTQREAKHRPTAHEAALALRNLAEAPLPEPSAPAPANRSAGGGDDHTGGSTTGNLAIPAPPNRAPSVG